jgi:hypothetical protein
MPVPMLVVVLPSSAVEAQHGFHKAYTHIPSHYWDGAAESEVGACTDCVDRG